MKIEDLKAQGLTDEQINFVMAEHGKVVNPLKAERDTYKTKLDTTEASLKKFDGVDVTELNKEIEKLKDDLKAKDTEVQTKVAEIEFNTKLDKAISGFGARNSKAVMALLDIDNLKGSKNQDNDIKTALETVKKDNSYLFQDVNVPRVVSSTPGINKDVEDKKSQANEALRSLFGKE